MKSTCTIYIWITWYYGLLLQKRRVRRAHAQRSANTEVAIVLGASNAGELNDAQRVHCLPAVTTSVAPASRLPRQYNRKISKKVHASRLLMSTQALTRFWLERRCATVIPSRTTLLCPTSWIDCTCAKKKTGTGRCHHLSRGVAARCTPQSPGRRQLEVVLMVQDTCYTWEVSRDKNCIKLLIMYVN